MKNDEIKQANRKALPKFLLFAVVCTIVGGVIGYYSGYGAAKGGIDKLAGIMKEAGAFFGLHLAPWLMLTLGDVGAGAYRAGGLHPDLSEGEETGCCVGW